MDQDSERSPRTGTGTGKHSSPREHHRTASSASSSSERKSAPGSPSKGEDLLKRTGSLRRKATRTKNLNGSFGRLSGSFATEEEKRLEKDTAARDPVLFALINEEIEKRQFIIKSEPPEDDADYMRELELLAQDEADIVSIAETVERSERISHQMVEILDSFDVRLAQLEITLEPLTEYTAKMERIHTNLEAALKEVERILSHLELPATMPPLPAQNHLSETLARLDRVAEAQAIIDSHRNFRSADVVTKQLKALRLPLLHSLESSFSEVLGRVCISVDPREFPADGGAIGAAVPEESVSLLRRICSHLSEWNQSNFATTWADRRGKFVLSSLRKLGPDAADRMARYERGSHHGALCARVILQLLGHEGILVNEVMTRVPSARRRLVLGSVAEPAVDTLLEILEIASKLPDAPVLSDQVAGKLFPLLDLWFLVNQMLPRYGLLLEAEGNKQYTELASALAKMSDTCKRCFSTFDEQLRKSFRHADIPSDGTVHELTANTMNFLRRLVEYRTAVDTLMPLATGSACADLVRMIFETVYTCGTNIPFIERVLNEMNSLLESRRKDKKAVLVTVFLLNNYHHILSSINSSSLKSAVNLETVSVYEKLIEHNKAMYRQSWNKALEYLLDINNNTNEASGKDTIKGKFKGFNGELESLFQTQRSYAIPDPDLRASLRADVKSVLLPFYQRFLQRHENTKFSDTPGKYIRYTPETLEGMLDRFFEDQVHQERRKTLAEKLLRF